MELFCGLYTVCLGLFVLPLGVIGRLCFVTFGIPGPEVIKRFSCSTVLLINLKLLTIANSFLQNIPGHENFSANKYENTNYCWHFHIY